MRQLTGSDAPAQRLLLPLTLDLTDEELDAVEAHAEELRRVGSRPRRSAGAAVVPRGAGAHPRSDAGACFREMSG
jgi:DNA mismatch repair ATPase MutL